MIDFLPATDDLLRQGAAQLSPIFRQAQIDFVLTQQTNNGGFSGSAGPADLYYTDFAVRCLVMLDGPDVQPFVHFPTFGADTSKPAARPGFAHCTRQELLFLACLKKCVVGGG